MLHRLAILLFSFSFGFTSAQDVKTIFEKTGGNQTATYHQAIEFYKKLSERFATISMIEFGETDSGFPLHLVVYDASGKLNKENLKRSTKTKFLINNGIHPGESDGIDASMLLIRDLAEDHIDVDFARNILFAVIPVYNIGGSLNRNNTTRVNQNGPGEYGFRGNAQNYDLNRDFIKTDTKNSKAFTEIFHQIDPDIFIDNHVSNGADYQYVLTHLFTQHNKLGGNLGEFLDQKMMPEIEKDLEKKNWPITPYVNVFNRLPDTGFSQFFDTPRYSTGYSTLFHSLGMMVETHMLKPYQQRVQGTYQLMLSAIKFGAENQQEIKFLRKKQASFWRSSKEYPLSWDVDSSKTTTLNFKGYEGKKIESEVTGLDRLKYDRTRPFTKNVTYYNSFKPKKVVEIPKAYIIPQGWWPVLERLKMNGIEFRTLENDTVVQVQSYQIKNLQTSGNPYEGHYIHYNPEINSIQKNHKFRKGDIWIATDQPGIRYLLETLEPEAQDSFFNWNFFDTVLQQKEGFSPYVFEDLASQILIDNPSIQVDLKKEIERDPTLKNNGYAQLDFIYNRSKYREQAYLEYPVYRVNF